MSTSPPTTDPGPVPGRLVVAIDGPSGSGKSSTARGVADRLGLDYLDTGAMYRAVTWQALADGLDLADTAAVATLTADLVRTGRLVVSLDPSAVTVVVAGHDVTAAIREPRVSAVVSQVATNLGVRHELVAEQRRIIAASRRGVVAEGRDITTVVAPDADVRLLLVADPTARVDRRHTELGDRGAAVTSAEVTDQVLRRDRDDATVSQFEQAADGVTVIDSTHLTLAEVIDLIVAAARGDRAGSTP